MRHIRHLVTAALLLLAGAGWAAILPSWYPESFKIVGTIDRLDVENDEIVIGDRTFRVTKDTQVHLLTRQNSSLNALATGMTVGCEETIDGAGRRTALTIYQLPDDYAGARIPAR